MGAVHRLERRSSPDGVAAGTGWFREEATIAVRPPELEKSFADHSPHAVPPARIPRGVRSISSATVIHNLRRDFCGIAGRESSALPARPEVDCKSAGSAACKYATKPAAITASATPATARCPIIMAGMATPSE